MKIAIVIVAIVLVVALLMALLRGRASPDLTATEAKIRDLVREVYAGNIVGERIERKGTDAVLVVQLQGEKITEMEINLSSLARKHEQEGLSLAVLKKGLRFD